MTPRNIDVIREGVVNDLEIDLNLQINEKGQGVEGQGLWKVGMWASANADGSGERVGHIEQVNDVEANVHCPSFLLRQPSNYMGP